MPKRERMPPMLSEYKGYICIACDECGRDVNTGVATNGDLGAWMDRYGWSNEMRDDGDYDYFCPTCTGERDRIC